MNPDAQYATACEHVRVGRPTAVTSGGRIIARHDQWRCYLRDAADGAWDIVGPAFATRAEALLYARDCSRWHDGPCEVKAWRTWDAARLYAPSLNVPRTDN